MNLVQTFTEDATKEFGLSASDGGAWRALAYTGSLGGGTLRVYTDIGGVITAVPDSKLTAATVDGNGDTVRQFIFYSVGTISVELFGSTAPECTVAIS